jgi:Ca-activated chloride channel homolog
MKTKHWIILILAVLASTFRCLATGLIIVSPPEWNGWVSPRFNPYSLEVRSIRVNVDIKELSAVTTIDEVFYNPSQMNLQGYFLFPVPKGSVIKNFSMEINGKTVQAELLDAKKARQIYEEIVWKALDPALLEYSGQDLFKVRIFPIEPMKEKRIKISYSQVLEKDNNLMEYVLPMNTKKFSAKPLNDVAVKINIENSSSIKTLYSPTHKVETILKNANHATVGYEEKNVKPDIDFKVYIGTDKHAVGVSLLTYKEEGEEGYFMLNVSPGGDLNNSEVVKKDITFVLDVSGSMTKEKMDQAKKALTFCVDHLNGNDRFEIIKFSTEANALFGKRTEASMANVMKAKEFIRNLSAIGGTNMDEAMTLALKEKNETGRPHFIIFITDGKPTIGEIDDDKLVKKIISQNLENVRIFTFAIGDDINSYLLDKLTDQTRAARTYLAPNEDLEIKVSGFFEKVSYPVLTEVKLSFDKNVGVSNLFPREMPDLFRGSTLTIFGRFASKGNSEVKLIGKVNDKPMTFAYISEFKDEKKYDFIPALWATRHVGYLLDQIRLNGEKKELVDEIVILAKKYGIITPYTSYLILEDEQINITQHHIPPHRIIFNNRGSDPEEFMKRNSEEYKDVQSRAGKSSIERSSELQNMSQANSIGDARQGQSRMMYKDKKGQEQNMASQMRSVQGRAVYQNENQWIDPLVQDKKQRSTKKVRFASEEYFALIDTNPDIVQFLSLGRNVTFVYKDKQYEIVEN